MASPSVAIVICASVMRVAAPAAPAEEGRGVNAASDAPGAPEVLAAEEAPPFEVIQRRCTSRRKLRMAEMSAARCGTQCPPSCRQIFR